MDAGCSYSCYRRICRSLVAFLLSTAPMKCLKGPVPRVVATASGEAAADQEMAHLLLAQELSGISRSEELGRYPPSFFAR